MKNYYLNTADSHLSKAKSIKHKIWRDDGTAMVLNLKDARRQDWNKSGMDSSREPSKEILKKLEVWFPRSI